MSGLDNLFQQIEYIERGRADLVEKLNALKEAHRVAIVAVQDLIDSSKVQPAESDEDEYIWYFATWNLSGRAMAKVTKTDRGTTLVITNLPNADDIGKRPAAAAAPVTPAVVAAPAVATDQPPF